MAITTRRDALNYVEDGLGSEDSRALAEIFCTITRWQTVDQLTDEEWNNVLDEAIRRENDGKALLEMNEAKP